jgi:hypothetical protein
VLTTPDTYFDKLTTDTIIKNKFLTVFSWRFAFKTEFIKSNKLYFDETLKYGEDVIYNFVTLEKANGILSISNKLYNYRHFRPDSLMGKVVVDKVKHFNEQIKILSRWVEATKVKEIGVTASVVDYVVDFIWNIIMQMDVNVRQKYILEFRDWLIENGLKRTDLALSQAVREFLEYVERVYENRESVQFVQETKQDGHHKDGFIKKKLKKIVPPSREVYYNDFAELRIRLCSIEDKVADNLSKFYDLNSKIDELTGLNQDLLKKLELLTAEICQ